MLSKQGWEVCVLERSLSLGGSICTEKLTVPGFRHDVLSGWHPLFLGSAGYAELASDLKAAGLTYLNTERRAIPDSSRPLSFMFRTASTVSPGQSIRSSWGYFQPRRVSSLASRWRSTPAAASRILNRLQTFISNLQDSILGQAILSPTDLERHNINLVGGDPYSGACDLDQFLCFVRSRATPITQLRWSIFFASELRRILDPGYTAVPAKWLLGGS